MSGSYWKVGDKLNLGQSDIEITCEGNNSFQENQVIGIFVPPSVKFFSGKDCRLKFDLKVECATTGTNYPTKLSLDGLTGANSLFNIARVYAGNRQQLLEETREYNSLISVKYSYERNDSIQQKRAMLEGCGCWTPESRGTLGTPKSIQNNMVYSPYVKSGNLGVSTATEINTTLPYTTAKVELQLHLGSFANSNKAFPCMLTQGVYIELTCESNEKVFRVLDGVSKHRLSGLNPVFHSINGTTAAGGTWSDGAASTTFYTTPDNSQLSPANSPFQVGEHIGFYNTDTNDTATMSGAPVITKIEQGNTIAPIKYTINSVSPDDDMVRNQHVWAVYSKSTTTESKPKYTISNCRLQVRQLDMTPEYISGMVNKMKSNGTILYDLPSYSTQLHSSLKTDIQATIPIDCSHSKARSIICMPTDATNYSFYANAVGYIGGVAANNTYIINTDTPGLTGTHATARYNWSDRSGISGIGDNLSKFSFIIDGKQVPNREIDCSKTSGRGPGIDANHIIEVEKCLKSGGITPLSFSDFRSNFIIGRALTLDPNTIYNGVGKEIRLNVKYEGTAPWKDHLWKIFIYHTKTLAIKGENIQVIN